MAQIREYQTQTKAYADSPNRQATGADFGSQVGDAVQQLGAVTSQGGEVAGQIQERNEVSRQYTDFSQAQVDWTQNFEDRMKEAQASDSTLVPKLNEDMTSYFDKMRSNYTSPGAIENFDRMANQMKTHFQTQAIEAQSQMAGKQAVVNWTSLTDNLMRTSRADPSFYGFALQQAKDAVNDPKGFYAKSLNTEQRAELIQNFEKDLAFATAKGEVQKNPSWVLSRLSPEDAAKLRVGGASTSSSTTSATITSPVVAFAPAKNAAPLAKYDPVIESSGSKYGVDPNFMRAQLMAESSGNPAAKNPSGSTGIAQFMPATAQQYGVDPSDPVSSIQGQARYMADLLNQFGGDYHKAAAAYNWGPENVKTAVSKYGEQWVIHAPEETRNYVDRIFGNADPIVSQTSDATVTSDNLPPVRSEALPSWFNNLDWKQQYELINDAKQGVRADAASKSQMLVLQERERKAAQRVVMDDFVDKAIDGKLTVNEVRNSTLDYEGKEHFINVLQSDIQGRNKTDPTTFWDLYQRVNSAPGAPGHISDEKELLAYGGKGLNFEDIKRLTGELNGRGSVDGQVAGDLKKQFFDAAQSQITKTTLTSRDSIGDGQFYQFTVAAMKEYDRKIKEGVSPMELFSPDSKEYLGNLIPLYARTAQQALKDQANALRAAPGASMMSDKQPPTARKPGESVQDYLARTGQ